MTVSLNMRKDKKWEWTVEVWQNNRSRSPRGKGVVGTSILKEELKRLEVCQRVEWKSDYERIYYPRKNDLR